VWDFSTSGLEGGLVFGWLGLCGFVLARWADADADADAEADAGRRLGLLGAAALGLGPLVRPDLLVVSLVALGGVLLVEWPGARWIDRLRPLAAAFALPVVYEVWRMGYYASLVPNTALAKSSSRSRWDIGFNYLRDFVGPYRLWLPLVLLLAAALVPALLTARAAGQRRALVALAALPVAGVLDGLYVVRVGGDYMHGRLLLPAFFALVVPVAAVPLPRLDRDRRASLAMAGGLAVVGVWVVVCLGWLRPGHSASVEPLFSSDARYGSVQAVGEHAVTADDVRMDPERARERLDPFWPVWIEWRPIVADPPGDLRPPVFAGWGIGVTGYSLGTDVQIIDLLGLGDPITARFELARPGFTGHEKPLPPPWLAAQVSEAPVELDQMPIPAIGVPLFTSTPGSFDGDTDAAREALACGDLDDLLTATRASMTPARFLSNLIEAPRNTRLAIPPDPHEAVERFC
jgi:arabinofuranosyltransferase